VLTIIGYPFVLLCGELAKKLVTVLLQYQHVPHAPQIPVEKAEKVMQW